MDCTTVGGRALEQPWVQVIRACVCELGGEWVEWGNYGSEWSLKV